MENIKRVIYVIEISLTTNILHESGGALYKPWCKYVIVRVYLSLSSRLRDLRERAKREPVVS